LYATDRRVPERAPEPELAPDEAHIVPVAEAEPAATREDALARALDRLADSFDRVAAGLEADRHDRLARLDDVDVLLRELVVGLTARAQPPVAVAPATRPSVVVAGTIDLAGVESESETMVTPEPEKDAATPGATRSRSSRR
jgi:hypothetical protein